MFRDGKSDRFNRSQQDLEGLQNGIVDRDNDRTERLSPEGDHNKVAVADGRHHDADTDNLTILQTLLMIDPPYAALYQEVRGRLMAAESATAVARALPGQRYFAAVAELWAVQDAASQLSDGRRVYRSADGRVFTEDGHQLGPPEDDAVDWKPGAPIWEHYQMVSAKVDQAREERDEVPERYQRDILQPARDRLNDEGNPPSAEALRDIDKRVKTQMPDLVLEYMDSGASIGRPHGEEPRRDEVPQSPNNLPRNALAFPKL